MSHGIKLKVWGDHALFSRPEMKAERVSYDVPTPSAARGIIEAIYWKPQIRWVIDRIHVLNPIAFTNIRRNEVAAPGSSGHKISATTANAVMRSGSGHHGIVIEDFRQQRASMILKDVAYIIEASFVILDPRERNGSISADPAAKHLRQFNDRALAGQCRHTPCFGCREFPVCFEPIEGEIPVSSLAGENDLGFMLYDIDFKDAMTPLFYRPVMIDGIIDVQKFWKNSPSYRDLR